MQLGGDLTKPTTISTSATNTLAITDLTTSTNTNDTPIVVAADGTLKKGAFPSINIVPSEIGTVIAVNGKLEVAQEIIALMSGNFSINGTTGTTPAVIGNITNIIVDNLQTFSGTATSNSFSVATTGVYSIKMSLPVIQSTGTQAIGLWNNTDNKWMARISIVLTGRTNCNLVSSTNLEAGKTYSFRAANTTNFTIEGLNLNPAGTASVASFSVKRLK
ncbi:hypothetical protein [Flavobacterium nitrogenifigens]|uniref:hypothetical protein n=1 Tax=Flavobacterium nitrogenifigens TaxID=1617283 RepID=UPI0011ECE27E|nr:hypothetical protein [Flavobacterium nitrogenifigens]